MKIACLSLALVLLIAACGGNIAVPTTQGPSDAPPTATQAPAQTLTPGGINYRLINLYHDASGAPASVDVYVRTQGLVQAAPVVLGLAFGEMTDTFVPPEPGTVAVTTAGAGDPTCVSTCPHIISTTGTGSGEGAARTIILYDQGALELWHNADPISVGTIGNALPSADLDNALVLTVAVALHGADFGLRVAGYSVSGCQPNLAGENLLVGGNQIGVFAFGGNQAAFAMHDSTDRECAEDSVGGPFAVSGGPGSRTLLVLYGEPGDMSALTLEI